MVAVLGEGCGPAAAPRVGLTSVVAPAPTLADLPVGARARIAGFVPTADPAVAARLAALGFRPGAVVEAVHRAPLGDPVVYRVCDYAICLRRCQSCTLVTAAEP